MKIKTLEFEAFGPYLTYQCLDFETLNDAEIFLVTGDTGAGKTTLFDAICFALYGVASGEIRQVSQFRNQKADRDTETYVRLTFAVRGHTYVITRYPNYPREGYKTENRHRVYLEGCQEHVIEGISEVAAKIKEIIGVNADEFRQVAMIAQGQFTRLILAPSKEREGILRELFATHDYAAFQDHLRQVEKNEKDLYQQAKARLDTLLEGAQKRDCDHPLTEMQTEMDHLQQQIIKHQQVLKEVQQQLKVTEQHLEQSMMQDQWQEQLDTLTIQKTALDQQRVEMDALQEEIRLLEKVKIIAQDAKAYQQALLQADETLSQLQKSQADVALLEQKWAECQLQTETMGMKEEEIKNNEITLEKINEDLNQVERFEKAKNLFAQAQKQLDNSQKELTSSQQQKHDLENILNKCKSDLQALPNLETLKLSLTHQSNMLQMQQEQCQQLEKQNRLLQQLRDEGNQAKQAWQHISAVYQKQTQEQLILEQNYQANLAGILASELQDQQPCPVCGSLDHPAPATIPQHAPTREDLDKHRQETENIAAEVQRSFGHLMAKKQALDLETEKFSQALQGQNLSDWQDNLQSAQHDFEKQRQAYLNQIQQQEKLQKCLSDYEAKFNKWQQKDQELQEKHQQLQANLTKRSETYEFIRGSFNEHYESLEILVRKKSQLERILRSDREQIKQFRLQLEQIQNDLMQASGKCEALEIENGKRQNTLSQAEKKYHQALDEANLTEAMLIEQSQKLDDLPAKQERYQLYTHQLFAITGRIKELESQLASALPLDSQQLKSQKASLEEQVHELVLEQEKAQWQLETKEHQYQEIQTATAAYEAALQRYQEIYELSRMVSGQNPLRMTFESYILAVYFEAILERANLRLTAMTNGRYALLRKQEQASSRALQGLDLMVMDYENGKSRDVRTLSGGETFKAALSLALGMADLISENAGGIELDTLFIDEGFGSLDDRSLDQALDTLLELKQDHKVIGIISHVAMLKERLQAKIIVTHEKNTSIAKIS